MPLNYYLDESGNTGDLILSGPDFSFSEQPFFVLSCLGLDDEGQTKELIAKLRDRHRVQASELKFAPVKKKPGFTLDLLEALEHKRAPILIEATDKRFLLCAMMVECLIVPPVCDSDYGEDARHIKNHFAERLAFFLEDDVLAAFCLAVSTKRPDDLSDAFAALSNWLREQPKDDINDGMVLFLRDTMNDYMKAGEDPGRVRRHLPVPDFARSGKDIHVLPHTMSLLHIYGRLNRRHGGNLRDVHLYHDEQVQFDRALLDGKALAESNLGAELPRQPAADFRFDSQAQLHFEQSDASAGIQVADVIAGTVAHLLKSVRDDSTPLSTDWKRVAQKLIDTTDAERGTGLNLVTTASTHQWLGLQARSKPHIA